MKRVIDSAKSLPFLRPCLLGFGLFFLLLLLTGAWTQPVAAQENDLKVLVDGRAVTVEGVEAQVNGATATYSDVLKIIGSDAVTAEVVDVFIPPDTPISVTQASAIVHGRQISLTNLTQPLAVHGRIGIWISGSTWRVCIIIVWGSNANLDVSVDGRDVRVEGVEAQVQGQPATVPQVVAFIGPDRVTADKIELFDPANPGVTRVVTEGVAAVMHGNALQLTGLSHEVALRGRIGIWVSGNGWRICVIIVWGSRANLDVTVDGREVTVEGHEAQLDGQAAELRRVLAFLGDSLVTAEKVEAFDPATPNNTQVLSDVVATIEGSHLSLTGLAPQLAARGRIGIWISGSRWRICIIIVWGSKANLDVTVDGREVTVEGHEAQLDGQTTELRHVLAFLGDSLVTAEKVEAFDPATPNNTQVLSDVVATVEGSHLSLTGLAPQLAARGRIGIWISGSRWRICIIIVWGSRANLDVTVDGREVTVEGAEAEIDGQATELRRVLALLGDGSVKADKVEAFDPATPSNTQVLSDVVATLEGSHLSFTDLAPQLAARGRIGIWISGSRWRICIVIVWGSKANLDVTVDGREVTVEGHEAQLDGQTTELRRVLAFLGDGAVTAEKVEAFDPATPNNTQVLSDVVATVEGSHLSLTGLAPKLAARGRIGIWVSGSRWRICIVIVWGSKANLDVTVDGREVTVEGHEAQLDGQTTELRRVLTFLGDGPVTADKVEAFNPATPNNTQVLSDVVATVEGSQIRLTGLANTLAARGRIGIWISGSRWRICIVITLGSNNSPRVLVDGRPVIAYQPVAELDGQAVDPRQVLSFLSTQAVTADLIEIEANGQPVTDSDATAVIEDGRILFTNLEDTLAARGRLSIWISGSRWRICIIIEWGRFTSTDGHINVDLPATEAHAGVNLLYTAMLTPTHPLPSNKRSVRAFLLDAQNSLGAEITQLDDDYTLEVNYTDGDLTQQGVVESTLQIYFFDEATGQWVLVPSTVNANNNKVMGTLDHFTEFALLGDPNPQPTQGSLFLPLVHK